MRMQDRFHFDGSRMVANGILDIVPPPAAGGAPSIWIVVGGSPAGSMTFSGGALRVRSDSGSMIMTGTQGNNLMVTENTTFTSERLSAASGVVHNFGSMFIGSKIFTVMPGPTTNGGNLSMSGDSLLNLEITGTQPEVKHTRLRVTGAVNLSGILGFYQTTGASQ